jgi:hypothetical protein
MRALATLSPSPGVTPVQLARSSVVLALVLSILLSCKPTYIDPVTHEEIACSELPSVTLEQTIAEVAQIYVEKGIDGVFQYAILKGVAFGGCAVAIWIQRKLSPSSGEQAVSVEESIALRDLQEDLRAEFLKREQERIKSYGNQPPPRRIIWINAAGQAL